MSTPKRIKRSIKKEVLQAKDYLNFKLPISCEDCSHFSSTQQKCSLGNNTLEHRKQSQTQSYVLSGTVAFCRLLEID